jgi:hypothetical protein
MGDWIVWEALSKASLAMKILAQLTADGLTLELISTRKVTQ